MHVRESDEKNPFFSQCHPVEAQGPGHQQPGLSLFANPEAVRGRTKETGNYHASVRSEEDSGRQSDWRISGSRVAA